MPIFRNAQPYNAAYGFQHLMWWLVSWGDVKQAVCTVHTVVQMTARIVYCVSTRPLDNSTIFHFLLTVSVKSLPLLI